MKRRDVILSASAALFGTSLAYAQPWPGEFAVTFTEAEWRERLTRFEFRVLRQGHTERAFSSPLVSERREGSYHCKGCQQMVYHSRLKYEAGTGWPSFFAAVEGRVGTRRDLSMNMRRVALFCTRCGSHLGHLYVDGDSSTDQRHSINGIALMFVPDR